MAPNPSSHGTAGPLNLSLPNTASDMYKPFIEGMNELGISLNPDPVGE
jgi:hypothetical protein